MNLSPGIIIKSTNDLAGTFFESSTIFLAELNKDGAVGFVINKPFARKLNDLVEFNSSQPFPLFDGGPVDTEHLFFVHQRPDLIHGGEVINETLFRGGDFKATVSCINNLTITPKDLRIFVGYCGWDAGELEKEIEEGSWTLQPGAQLF